MFKFSRQVKTKPTFFRKIMLVMFAIQGVNVSYFWDYNAASAQEMSSETIEQFKALPRAQQEQMAAQYGVDLDSLLNAEMTDRAGSREEGRIENESTRLSPVKTVFVEEIISVDEDAPLPRYGAHLFDQEVSTFAPIDNVPVPQGYLLGSGDTLRVTLFGQEQGQSVLTVDREGNVSFPRLGAMHLAGLRFPEAKKLIDDRVTDQMIGTNVMVSMGELRTINVFMAGEVRTPGGYSISALSTLTQALYAAGGTTKIGAHRGIQVRRDNKIVALFDLYDLLLRGDPSGDIRILSGDVVFVPVARTLVDIDGAIRRPGKYELLEGETLGALLNMAGGVDAHGFRRNARLIRYANLSLPQLIELNLLKQDQLDMKLYDGDVIEIETVSNRPSNAFTLKGAIARPGIYAWTEQVRLSDFITDPDADLIEETDLRSGLIVRRRNERLEIDVISFNPIDVIENPKTSIDPLLRPFDEVLFFSLPITEEISVSATEQRRTGGAEVESEMEETTEDLFENSNEFGGAISERIDLSLGARVVADRTDLLKPVISRLKAQAGVFEEALIVSIFGAVREPGEYPLLKNGTLEELVNLAGGFTDGAYLDSIEIRRIDSLPGTRATTKIVTVNINRSAETDRDEIYLESRDAVRINNIPNWNPTDSIILEGEVVFPGEYLINPGETLNSIVERAGGLTENAFADGAFFTRETIKEAENQQLQLLANSIIRAQASKQLTSEQINNGGLSSIEQAGNTESAVDTLLGIESVGRLVIDLPKIVRLEGGSVGDLEVQGGDKLVVPQKTNAISVVGELHRPGSFVYQTNLKLEDYIELAAGFTPRADKKDVYIVKANGTVIFPSLNKIGSWFKFETSNIEVKVGDTIVVPVDQEFKPPLTVYQEISTVVFQGIVSIASILAIGK